MCLKGGIRCSLFQSQCPAFGIGSFAAMILRCSLHEFVVLACKHVSEASIVGGMQVAVPAALGVAALIAGQFGGGLMMLAMAALAGLAFYFW